MRAIIYCRVSSDPKKEFRSVGEQEQECRDTCARNGWDVAEVLTDNDVGASRYSRVKDRPAYDKLKKALKAGDVLVLWEASRASRTLDGYTELRDLCAERGVLWNIGGTTYDPSKSNDRVMTGIRAILSEDESHQIRERVLRTNRARAKEGLAHGRIPYGYRAIRDPETGRIDARIPDEAEAAVIREAARRIIAGETAWAVAQDFNARGIATPGGAKTWTGQRLGLTIKRPTHAGLRAHHGVITQGDWTPILAAEEHARLVDILEDPKRRTQRGVAPKHLLSGIARCGAAGCGMTVERIKNGGYDSYVCSSPGRHVGRRIPHVDALVTDAVLTWCETTSIIDDDADPEAALADREARELRARLDAAADEYADGVISITALSRIEAKLEPRIKDAESRARQAFRSPHVADLLGENARATWEDMPITSRRSVVRSLISVTINPAPRGPVFRPEYVRVEWI